MKQPRITELLSQTIGGFWERYRKGESIRWSSPDHRFYVYKTSEVVNGSGQQVYRRSDTKKVVLRRGKSNLSKRFVCPRCNDLDDKTKCVHCDGTGEIGDDHIWMVRLNEFEATVPLVYRDYGFYYGKKRYTAAKAEALYRLKKVEP